ncbi:MAG TPA: DUF2934 domain-containing protein [Chthoniobacteraceae bacterium]|nr:DUF2934 domain-containing protein [Chthoniobacteraceae bacterium]
MQKKATTKTKKSGRSTTAASKRKATTATRDAQAPLAGNGSHDAASGGAIPAAATGAAAATPRKRAPSRKRTATPPANHDGHAIGAEQIALRAYYLAEHRQQRGLPGDANSDWLEAETQLRAEAEAISARPIS